MSILNLNKKYIFVHIPKTAGTSMEKVLGEMTSKHADIKEYKNMLDMTKESIDDFWKFSFVRNPYDRLMSGLLNHIIKARYSPLTGERFYPQEETSEHEKEVITDFIINKSSQVHTLLRPQHTFVELDGVNVMDFIGRFENLNEDWNVVREKIGIGKELPHNHRGYKRDYDALYTPETREIIANHYKKDFEMFGYEA